MAFPWNVAVTAALMVLQSLLTGVAFGQAPATAAPTAPVCVVQERGASAPAVPGTAAGSQGQVAVSGGQSDRLDGGTLVQRGLGFAVIGAGGAYGARKVSGVMRGAVNVGKVRHVPHYGKAAASLPIVGGAAASGHLIPTTIGQVPVMGAVVKQVPLVGPVVAGPANPILVGAVAIDTYVIPKYSPCGYTHSSLVAANNDFNTPPKLRHYVNYLAPLPYTHPPIYAPATLNTDVAPDNDYIDEGRFTPPTDVVVLPQ